MSKKMKVLSSLTLLVLAGFIGGYFYLKSKIDSLDLKKLVVQTVQENLHQASVQLVSVDYSISKDVKLLINDFAILDEKKERVIAAKQMTAYISIWSLISGNAKVSLEVKALEAFAKKVKNEWNLAYHFKKESKQTKNNSKKRNIEIPGYVEKSILDIKLLDTKLFVRQGKEESLFNVKKVIVKKLGLNTNSAFEVLADLKEVGPIKSAKGKLIGSFSLKEFISSDKVQLNSTFNLANIFLQEIEDEFGIRGKVDVVLNKETLDLKLSTSRSHFLNGSMKVTISDQVTKLSSVDLKIPIKDIKTIIGNKRNEDLSATLNVTGKVSFENEKMIPDLKLIMSEEVNSGTDISFLAQGSMTASGFELRAPYKYKNGEGELSIKASSENLLDWRKGSYFGKVSGSGFKFSRDEVQEYLYSKSSEKVNSQSDELKSKKTKNDTKLPQLNLVVDFDKLYIDQTKLSLKGELSGYNDFVKSHKMYLGVDESKNPLTIKYSLDQENLSYVIENINTNLSSFNVLLPKQVKGVSGKLNGVTKANVSFNQSKNSDSLSSSLIIKDGFIKDLNLKMMFSDLLGKYGHKVPEKKSNLSEQFDVLETQFGYAQNQLKFKNLDLVGHAKKSRLKIKGVVSMNEESESALEGFLMLKDVKALANKELPVQLKGKGMSLKPNLAYTAKQASKQLVKKEVKKIQKKAEDKAKEIIKDKAKELLKKFKI